MSSEVHRLRKIFVKDFGLPIQVVQNPYFDYFMNLYDSHFGTLQLYDLFKKTVGEFENSEDFLSHRKSLINRVIDTVAKMEAYREFSEVPLPPKSSIDSKIIKSDVFLRENNKKIFVTFDLKKANFQVMHLFNSQLTLGYKTYEEFVKFFTDYEYFQKSKHMRQVIFGSLNPKKQRQIQEHVVIAFVKKISHIFDPPKIYSKISDEVSVELDEDSINYNQLNELGMFQNYEFVPTVYRIKTLSSRRGVFFVRENLDGTLLDIRGVPSYMYAQAFKKYFELPLNEHRDLAFYFENQLATFLEPIKWNPLKNEKNKRNFV